MAQEILIVDDEDDIREQIAGILEDEGYQTRTAGSGEAALEAVAARLPSLVILDVWLTGSAYDGLQILDLLKGGPRTIPEMVATMYADVPQNLHPAAARSVLAHLIHMAHDGRVAADGEADARATYRAA